MSIDCVVCGTCCVDIVMRPMPLQRAFGRDRMRLLDTIQATTGGIVANVGNAMGRLGLNVAALSFVGRDHWASVILNDLESNQVDTSRMSALAEAGTSITAVMIDENGEHSFGHFPGAMASINARLIRDNIDLFAASKIAMIGYYALMPEFDAELPNLMPEIHATGCQTAMDAAGAGGSLQPLDRILPHLDFYVPSLAEARSQTGEDDPQRMIEVFRECGAPGLLGIKLGADGALLSPRSGDFLRINAVSPPGEVVDTTGAGDCFYAGLLAGLMSGHSIEDSGKIGAAAGACCITEFAGTQGVIDLAATAALAGVSCELPTTEK